MSEDLDVVALRSIHGELSRLHEMVRNGLSDEAIDGLVARDGAPGASEVIDGLLSVPLLSAAQRRRLIDNEAVVEARWAVTLQADPAALVPTRLEYSADDWQLIAEQARLLTRLGELAVAVDSPPIAVLRGAQKRLQTAAENGAPDADPLSLIHI